MNPLLIVIDMQEGFRSPEAEAIIPAVTQLVAAFPESAFACFRNEPGSQFERELHWTLFQSSAERRVLHELKAGPVFEHAGYTILTPELLAFAQKRSLFLCGIYTDVCVSKAALDAFDRGIPVRVISDACASAHGPEQHAAALESLRRSIGRRNVLTAAEALTRTASSS